MSVFLFILYTLSFFYSAIIKFLRIYRSRRKKSYDISIISVGNITWGGTGKTPLVIDISRYLKDRGGRVSIVHHGRSFRDESDMIAESLNLEIPQSRSKKEAIERIVNSGSSKIAVLDDGYQQWGIKKDLDILCLNYRDLFGNGFLIPRGSLREKVSNIDRADLILINKFEPGQSQEDIIDRLRRFNKKAPLVFTRYKIREIEDLLNNSLVNPAGLENKPLAIITAVADPDYFRDTLKGLKANLIQEFIYPDHYRLSGKDFLEIKKRFREDLYAFCITSKDYVKLEKHIELFKRIFPGKTILAIKIKMEFLNDPSPLFRRLDILLDSIRG